MIANALTPFDLHNAVLASEQFFESGRHAWKYLPTYENAVIRNRMNGEILRRARKPRRYFMTDTQWEQARSSYANIARRIGQCSRNSPCGSFACKACRGGFARAQREAFQCEYDNLQRGPSLQPISFITVVPHGIAYSASTLHRCSTEQLQFWLLSRLSAAGLSDIALFGVLELSYEEVAFRDSYFQPHWHLLAQLSASQKDCVRTLLPSPNPNNPAVDIRPARNEGVLNYMCKVVEKGHRWLGSHRPPSPVSRAIPPPRLRELLQWADSTLPLQVLILQNYVTVLVDGRLRLAPVHHR